MYKLYNEDCFSNLDKVIDGSVDLICTDPPYGIDYSGCNWDDSKIFESSTKKWLELSFKKLKDNGTLWSFMSVKNVCKFIQLAENTGFICNYDNWVVWARQKGRESSKHLKSSREDIIHFTKSKTHTWNPLRVIRDVVAPYKVDGQPRGWFVNEEGRRVRWSGLGNVWPISAPFHKYKTDISLGHPHQKPKMLIERLIILSSNKGDLVLDPFMGTGTAGECSIMNGRNFIGFENDINHYKIAEKRIKDCFGSI